MENYFLMALVAAEKSLIDELWKSDGTTEGTSLVAEINIEQLEAVGSTVYLSANNGYGSTDTELWKSDGTPEGTQLLLDIRPEERSGTTPVNYGSSPENLIEVGGTLFFTADDGVNRRIIYCS